MLKSVGEMRISPTGGIFTQYVRGLDPNGTPPSKEAFERVWGNLRNLLWRELAKRSLCSKPPRWIGILGQTRWTDPGKGVDALTELTADCYSFVFVHRLKSLVAQASVRVNIDGLIFRNISNFIHDRQRRHDPLGTRIYDLLRSVLSDCVEAGELSGGEAGTIDASTVLRSSQARVETNEDLSLQDHIQSWADELMPELITTRGRGQRRLEQRLRALIVQLPRTGVVSFSLGDLNRLLRDIVRHRWRSVAEVESADEVGLEPDGERVQWVPLVPADTSYDAKNAFDDLVRCVKKSLTEATALPGKKEEGIIRHIGMIWNLLLAWASERGELESPFGKRDPSMRRLARVLDLPRDRIAHCMTLLQEMVLECRSGSTTGRGARVGKKPASELTGESYMAESIEDRLRLATGEAMKMAASDQAGSRTGHSLVPGQVFALRATADWDIEWIVIDEDPSRANHWYVIAADDNPLLGEGDLEIGDSVRFPFFSRCRQQTSVAAQTLEQGALSRTIASRDLERIRRTVTAIDGGKRDPSPLRRDTSTEPAYLEWTRSTLEPARQTLEALLSSRTPRLVAPSATERESPARRWQPEALAAIFAVTTLGLTLLAWVQHAEQKRSNQPRMAPPSATVLLGDQVRDPEAWRIEGRDRELVLDFVLRSSFDCDRFDIELLAEGDAILWTFENLTFSQGKERVLLPRAFLEEQPVNLRLFGHCKGKRATLGRQKLRIIWSSGALGGVPNGTP